MQTGLEITLYLVLAMVAGGIGATVAPMRGRTATFWMPASFLFPPIVGVLFLLPNRRAIAVSRPAPRRETDSLDHLLR